MQYKDNMCLLIPVDSEFFEMLSDLCYSICYQTGSSFYWLYPGSSDSLMAIFSFKTQVQKENASRLMKEGCKEVPLTAYTLIENFA